MAGYRKLPSGKWQATVRLPDGRRRTRTDPLKRVVQQWATDAEAALRRGEWADPQDGRQTVAEWFATWSATRVIEQATTLRDASHWRTHVEPRWGRVRLMAVTTLEVEAWIADMKRAGVGPTVAQQSVRLLRHMLSDAARHKIIGTDPTAGVKLPKIPRHVDRFLTLAEFDALAEQLEPRDQALVTLMAFCGLRWEEAAGLHAHRVDLDRDRLLVVEVLQRDGSIKAYPKSSAGQRYVPVGPRPAGLLVEQLPASGLVFPGLHYTNWRRRVFVPAVERAGLVPPLPTPHDLRHTYGSWLADRGMPLHDIKALMGHGSLRSTERYLHSSGERFDRALTVLDGTPAIRAAQ